MFYGLECCGAKFVQEQYGAQTVSNQLEAIFSHSHCVKFFYDVWYAELFFTQ